MRRGQGPGLTSTGNRVLLAVVAGLLMWWGLRSLALAAVAAVVVYLLATLVSRARS
jgi:ABC-type bacteriocin/lantibiotic exporter with double-glycine peptidase domain